MIDDVVNKLFDKGVNGFLRDVKECYKEEKRSETYGLSLITQKPGNYYGKMILLDSGGCLVLEHDVDNNLYHGQFNLITANRRGIKNECKRALDGISDGKKYYKYNPSYINCSSADDLVSALLSNKVFVRKAITEKLFIQESSQAQSS